MVAISPVYFALSNVLEFSNFGRLMSISEITRQAIVDAGSLFGAMQGAGTQVMMDG